MTGITGQACDEETPVVPDPVKTAKFDLLDVIEGISALFHEHHDAIIRWSWKLFCAKWARMLDTASKRALEQFERDRERERKQQADRQMQDLQAYTTRSSGFSSDGY